MPYNEEDDRFAVVESRVCIEPTCGKTFDITAGEKRFFEEKNYSLPSRCKDCRAKRRAQKDAGVKKY